MEKTSTTTTTAPTALPEALEKTSGPIRHKRTRRLNYRTKPLYDNCRLFGPDNTCLARIYKTRALNYLRRGLAELLVPKVVSEAKDEKDIKKTDAEEKLLLCIDSSVCTTLRGPKALDLAQNTDGPLNIRLLFKPKGPGNAVKSNKGVDENASAFYLSTRQNLCVVCGTTQRLCVHSIVPRGLREAFSKESKSRSHHDIVLLCVHCRMRFEKNNYALVVQMCHELNVRPFYDEWRPEEKAAVFANQQHNRKLNALVKHQNGEICLPLAIANEYEQLVTQQLKEEKPANADGRYSIEQIRRAMLPSLRLEDHYEQLIKAANSKYGEKDGCFVLTVACRKNFIDVMKPQFLSPFWSVEHRKAN